MTGATSTPGILERFRSGDQQAFASLFDKYRRPLAVWIHFHLSEQLRGSMEVDDVLQEVFLAAVRDLDSFDYRGPGSFLRWLTRIAAHTIADTARHQSREKRAGDHTRFRSESNPLGPEPAISLTPSRIFSENEELRRLVALLQQLPEDYRQVIVLAKFEGLTTPEIAARMERSRETVALLLHRALKRLRVLHAEAVH